MRSSIALVIAGAIIAAPASAQETNQANAAETPPAVVAEPDAATTNAAEPGLPTIDEAARDDLTLEPIEPAPPRGEPRGFPWGLLGLLGLIGLLGRARS